MYTNAHAEIHTDLRKRDNFLGFCAARLRIGHACKAAREKIGV